MPGHLLDPLAGAQVPEVDGQVLSWKNVSSQVMTQRTETHRLWPSACHQG
jgi:hypothetical protein